MNKLVSEIMHKNIILVHAEDTIEKVERIFRIHKGAFAAVMDEEGLFYGLITASLLFGFQMAAKNLGTLKAREICTQKIVTVNECTSVKLAVELLIRKNAEHLVIMENDQVLGVLSSMHLLKELLLEIDPCCLGVQDKKGFFIGLL